jgi:predicted transcriptional regulator
MSKSYNPLNYCIPVSTELEEAGRWLLQLLYDNYDSGKYVSSSSISDALEIDEASILDGLNKLIEAQLVDSRDTGYRLSEKGYTVVYQRATSFCPHL